MTNVEMLDEAAPKEQLKIGLAEQIKADSTRIEYEVDAIGRRIGVRKLNFHGHYRLAKLLGQNSGNPAMMTDAMMAASVVEIDGDPIPMPGTELQLEALMQRLDFHGVAAAATAMGRFTPIGDANQAEIKN
jgi:hypothetical protein